MIPPPITSAPEWRGEPVNGKRILVWPSEGWGDQIMWGRYLPELLARGAQITVAAHPKLVRLFERLGYNTFVVAEHRPVPVCDYWITFGLLPLRLGWPPPAEAVYIDFPHRQGGGVGVMPTGNPTYHNDANRSLFGAHAERLLDLGQDLRPEATGLYDFADTADLICGFDLIVTVDTALANLAGSMGKACWVLIPRIRPSYRWGGPRGPTWYPGVQQYRQTTEGDWTPVLDHIQADLALRSSARPRDTV